MEKEFLTKYQAKLKKYLTKKGFDNNQIQVFLDGFTRVDKISFYSPTVSTTNFQSIFELLEIYPYSKVKQMQPALTEAFEAILNEKNLTLNDAIALNRWSVIPNEVLNYKRNGVSINRAMKNSLYEYVFQIPLSTSDYKKIFRYIQRQDVSIDKEVLRKRFTKFTEKNNFDKALVGSLLQYIDEKKRILQTANSLDKVVTTQLSHNTIFYRGLDYKFLRKINNYLEMNKNSKKGLVDLIINEQGYSSTSYVIDNNFIKTYPCPVILEIFAPKGSECFDMVNFSKFPDEKEILFNANEMKILDYDLNWTGLGEPRVLIKCFLLSKNTECYKDIGNKEKTNPQIKNEEKE